MLCLNVDTIQRDEKELDYGLDLINELRIRQKQAALCIGLFCDQIKPHVPLINKDLVLNPCYILKYWANDLITVICRTSVISNYYSRRVQEPCLTLYVLLLDEGFICMKLTVSYANL